MADEIQVHTGILDEILRHAWQQPEIECCGLLAGRDGIITTIYPATNALASPTAYEIAARELFSLFRKMHEEQLDHLGLYHSHPAGENIPSARDIELACYPDQAYFIVSPRAEAPKHVRAFSIRDGCVHELEIVGAKQ